MKLVYVTFIFTLTLLILIPKSYSFQSHAENRYKFLNKGIHNFHKTSTDDHETKITYPDPKRIAFELLDSYYDNERLKCKPGIKSGNTVRKVVMDYIASTKIKKKNSPKQKKLDQVRLVKAMLHIKRSFSHIYDSKCDAILKAIAKRFTRRVFLLTLKYYIRLIVDIN